jgi:hypothetical protein
LFQGSLVFDICQRALISSVTLVPVLVDEAHVPRDPRVCREQPKSCLKQASRQRHWQEIGLRSWP